MGAARISHRRSDHRGRIAGILITLAKALLTAILGLAALVALAATVCGMVLTASLPQGGWRC